jgi:Na+/H+-dicarboxylate symporter
MKLALHWKIIIGLIAGILWAFLSSYAGWSEFTLNWIDPFGKIFMRLLKMIAIPLVLFSIIKGVTDMKDISKLGSIGFKTLGLYLGTTVLAVTIGLVIGSVVKPGEYLAENERVKNRLTYEMWALDEQVAIKGNSFLENEKYAVVLAEADSAYQAQSKAIAADAKFAERQSNAKGQSSSRPLQFLVDVVPDNFFASLLDTSKMLQIIFFALFFSIALLLIPEHTAQPLLGVIGGLNDVFLKMIDLVMAASPYLVFALIAGNFSELAKDDPSALFATLKSLGVYSLTVLFGLAVMIFLIYPLLVVTVTKRKGKSLTYGSFFKRISPAQFLAFSTSSSAATLPVTIDCVQDRIGVTKEVTGFVLPIGATVNMDGTSLYQVVAALFLAQMHFIELSFMDVISIGMLSILASIGSAAVPSAGIVMLMVVLISLDLNPAWIAFILPVDRILDMCRTVVNVTGDTAVATVVAATEGQLEVIKDEVLDKS